MNSPIDESKVVPLKRTEPDSGHAPHTEKQKRRLGKADVRKLLLDRKIPRIPDTIEGLQKHCGLGSWISEDKFLASLTTEIYADKLVQKQWQLLYKMAPEVTKVNTEYNLTLNALCGRINSRVDDSASEFESDDIESDVDAAAEEEVDTSAVSSANEVESEPSDSEESAEEDEDLVVPNGHSQ